MLISIVIGSVGSRKKILAVGGTFFLVTSAVYGLFIFGLLGVQTYIGYYFWIRAIAAVFALTIAFVNIKDFFLFKEGISFSIPDRYKPKILDRMRDLRGSEGGVLFMVWATAVMAMGVALIELPCTAGFPIVWTNILQGYDLGFSSMAGLFLLYLLVYFSLEFTIFLTAFLTMGRMRLQEAQGRFLKLLGRVIMLALVFALIFVPELMESVSGTIYLFGTAAAVSVVVALVYRWLVGFE